MSTLIVALKDLVTDPDRPLDLASLPEAEAVEHIKAIYRYLGDQVEVTIADGVAVITLPDAHAQRVDRALARFAEAGHASRRGRYAQAIRLYKEGLEILPGHAESRRQLGMAYMENGNFSAAKTQLIRAIQLDPHDAWAHLILGNLYFQAEHDLGSAERYYAAARDLAPDDAYVLNSYAGLLGKRGRFEEAAALFERAIELAPQLPAPRLGLALALSQQGDVTGALSVLESLFAQPISDDPRHAHIYTEARHTYTDLRQRRAVAGEENAMRRMRQVLAEYEADSGVEVRLEADPTLLTDAKIELAWRTGRPYHAIKFAGGAFRHIQLRTSLNICVWRKRRERPASTACSPQRLLRLRSPRAASSVNCVESAIVAAWIPYDSNSIWRP